MKIYLHEVHLYNEIYTLFYHNISFLITKLTAYHWSKPLSVLDTSLDVYLIFNSEPYLGISKESNNQGMKVQVKRTFKSYSFLSHTHTRTHTHTHTGPA